MSTALADRLRRRIALTGPITVADFMLEALAHPALGYYRRAPAVGAAGDFVTAPEISQMFGELVGAWLAERWMAIGQPARIRLVELGPGRGTLLVDALRATRGVPGFHAALDLHLVEIDDTLRALQHAALASSGRQAHSHTRFEDVPDDAPLLLIANEFFDALPIRQLVRAAPGWCERMIGLADDEAFAFAVAPGPSPLARLLDASVLADPPDGAVIEVSPAALSLVHAITERIMRQRGAALIVDYGYDDSSHGDTLQAMYRHTKIGIFDRIGDSDLTAHVDIAALARAVTQAGAAVDGPTGQGDFLRALGIEQRAQALRTRATPQQAADIDSAMARLIAPDRMGTLFRVLAVRDPLTPPAPGFAVAGMTCDPSSGPMP
ncbi:class I SAM-dependent methyltransferase [Reyranella sp. CPCC 100927]|uniref:class I SAM-dependent methyltransferase n=1 Tax=Reyranella sp. CPCC 100927 TaxID=2599616 RepID=UPI0011B4F4A8|nr:SAM-dependent methyltransferase [Reyranella sp. CPCC 100927]TWT03182.1 class I SAM-dependent methyltransferase [Reyranella sp. CPCC 100927]